MNGLFENDLIEVRNLEMMYWLYSKINMVDRRMKEAKIWNKFEGRLCSGCCFDKTENELVYLTFYTGYFFWRFFQGAGREDFL